MSEEIRDTPECWDGAAPARPSRTGYEGRSLGGFIGRLLIGADPRIKAGALYVSGAKLNALVWTCRPADRAAGAGGIAARLTGRHA